MLFDTDPDPNFHPDADPVPDLAHHFDVDPDADPDFYLMRMRIRMRIPVTKMMRIRIRMLIRIHNTDCKCVRPCGKHSYFNVQIFVVF